jgi:hypothetical protein
VIGGVVGFIGLQQLRRDGSQATKNVAGVKGGSGMVERICLTQEEGFPKRDLDHVLRDIAVKQAGIAKTVERLGGRIDEAFDWRIQAARHPYVAVAAAAGVGFWMSGLLKPSSTPARRALDMVSQTIGEVAEGLRGSAKAGSADHVAPTTMKTLLGTAVVRAGMDFLYKRVNKRVNEALQASQGPNHETPVHRSNGSSAQGAHRALDHEKPIGNTGWEANNH